MDVLSWKSYGCGLLLLGPELAKDWDVGGEFTVFREARRRYLSPARGERRVLGLTLFIPVQSWGPSGLCPHPWAGDGGAGWMSRSGWAARLMSFLVLAQKGFAEGTAGWMVVTCDLQAGG